MQYIRVPDRKTGEPRFSAQADHIIPREVWGILRSESLIPNDVGRPLTC